MLTKWYSDKNTQRLQVCSLCTYILTLYNTYMQMCFFGHINVSNEQRDGYKTRPPKQSDQFVIGFLINPTVRELGPSLDSPCQQQLDRHVENHSSRRCRCTVCRIPGPPFHRYGHAAKVVAKPGQSYSFFPADVGATGYRQRSCESFSSFILS